MNVDWQNAITVGLVAAAAVYVIRRLWYVGRGRQTGGCGTCSDCPAPDRDTLISIDPPPKR